MDVVRTKCSNINSATLPGYRKGAYIISTSFGISFKNLDYESRFGVVMHQNMTDKGDILAEIFQIVNGRDTITVPYETLKKLTIGTKFHDMVVDRNGHGFISGLEFEDDFIRPSLEMCRNSKALEFLRVYGTALSIALKYPDVVHSLEDGVEFNMKVRDIIAFDDEMNGNGIYTRCIEDTKTRIEGILKEMESDDREIAESHRQFSEAVELLKHYGINYQKRKVA